MLKELRKGAKGEEVVIRKDGEREDAKGEEVVIRKAVNAKAQRGMEYRTTFVILTSRSNIFSNAVGRFTGKIGIGFSFDY